MIKNQELQTLVNMVKEKPSKKAIDDLADAFIKMAEDLLDSIKFEVVDRDDAIQECVMIAFDKLDRYDHTKAKAFCYFSTVMLSMLRQVRKRR